MFLLSESERSVTDIFLDQGRNRGRHGAPHQRLLRHEGLEGLGLVCHLRETPDRQLNEA